MFGGQKTEIRSLKSTIPDTNGCPEEGSDICRLIGVLC